MSEGAARAVGSPVRTLAVVFPGCAYLEIAHAVARCRAHGEVRFVAPRRAALHTNDGPRIDPDDTFDDAALDGVRVVLVPGGELDAVKDDAALSALLIRAASAGAVIGGICNGAPLLGRAGLLRGRRATHTAVERYASLASWGPLRAYADPLLVDSTYVDRPVVVDGAIVTAKPWAAIAFASEVCGAAGLEGPVEAAREANYARGERVAAGAAIAYRVVALRAGTAPMTRALVEAHVAYLRELDREGRLVLAGPLAERGEGLVVVRAESEDDARAIAARDPFVLAGARVADVWTWEISSEANAHMGIARGPLAP